MNRDCGKGELIPTSYKLLWHPTMEDREYKAKYLHLQEALKDFEQKRAQLQHNQGSDVRLYACDKQGYCNCILSAQHCKGKLLVITTNRLSELPSR